MGDTHREESNMETLRDRYNIYVTQARLLGWPIKTFEEWLNS